MAVTRLAVRFLRDNSCQCLPFLLISHSGPGAGALFGARASVFPLVDYYGQVARTHLLYHNGHDAETVLLGGNLKRMRSGVARCADD